MNNNLNAALKVILDSSGIGKGDIAKIQKILAKYTVNVSAGLDKAQLVDSVKKILPQAIKEACETTGVKIKLDIDEKLIKESVSQAIQEGQRLQKELAAAQAADGIRLSMAGKNTPDKNYDYQIDTEIGKLKKLGLTEEETAQKIKVLTDAQAELKRVMESDGFDSDVSKNKAIIKSDKERTIALNQVRTAYGQLKNDMEQNYDPDRQIRLSSDIQDWLSKNGLASKEARESLAAYYDELGGGRVSVDQLDSIEQKFKSIQTAQGGIGKLGAHFKTQFSQVAQSFTHSLSIGSGISFLVSKAKEAVSELKEVDNCLTEIGKADGSLTKADLRKLGRDSFDIASKYGISATDYLASVQETSRAGYQDAAGIAELSVSAQSAGDMTAELANQIIMATDKAYQMNGSVSELTRALDGMNHISHHDAVSMSEMSEAMSIVGSTAASSGVDVGEAAAVLGTMMATTRQGGSEAAKAFKAILLNIRQVSDEEEGIDAKGLASYEKACNALGVSLRQTKDGILSLRDPMEVLRDLAAAYGKLGETDSRKSGLLGSLGDTADASQFDALLSQWDTYEAMLHQYSTGTGSMAVEAGKTADSWEGSMNRLGNTWTSVMNNLLNSDAIVTVINALNGLLSVIDNVTATLGSFGTVALGGLGVGITQFIKNLD